MKITIENTSETVEVNGIPARVWEGLTESGIKVQCLITRIAVQIEDCSQFEKDRSCSTFTSYFLSPVTAEQKDLERRKMP